MIVLLLNDFVARLRTHQPPQIDHVLHVRWPPRPIETRTAQRPSMTVGVRYASPESLIACAQRTRVRVERRAVESRRLVAHHQRLQTHRRENLPVRRARDFGLQPLRVCEIAAEARLQAGSRPDRGSRTRA